jgi:FtsP/CotA-like multicopper oxidase with cupredoxin domain
MTFHTRLTSLKERTIPMSINYIIGSLFPKNADGKPNIKLSSSLATTKSQGNFRVVNKDKSKNSFKQQLKADLNITSDPVTIRGVNKFLTEWYIPEVSAKLNDDGSVNENSIFGGVYTKIFGSVTNNRPTWLSKPRNQSMKSLIRLGYIGEGADSANTNDSYWSSVGTTDSDLYAQVTDLDNYQPVKMWSQYDPDSVFSNTINSDYDENNLKQNLPAGKESLPEGSNPNLWYPAMLYSYGLKGEGTSYPGPVLITQPGDRVKLNFDNDIQIGKGDQKLTTLEIQQATLVPNSTYGNSASDGLGGTTSLNYHLHGSHTNPAGFGDNVVSRFTTGQEWTTIIDLPEDHGQGSYWYHPHYHPSVNQQVYGGASGFMQIGDPLSKIPGFKDVPRNLAVLKMMDVGVDPETGELQLDAFDNYGGPLTNAMTMATVNGEFQPNADAHKGGWQSLTLSNQSNQAFYNISLIHQDTGNRLPLYIYGEDGHQFPQIRAASGALSQATDPETKIPIDYKQQKNVVSMAPGKRVDVLVYLPNGSTEIASHYNFDENGVPYTTANMGGYPDLSTEAKSQNSISSGKSAGPLAIFEVKDGTDLPSTSKLDRDIAKANKKINVQSIEPSTKPEEYNSDAIPSVNLFETNKKEQEKWKPLRKREFNWAKGVLVGDPSEWDLPTQERISNYNATADETSQFGQYDSLGSVTKNGDNWFGYNNPFLINDHVFPNGSITIAQLGTMEEWNLRNWSVLNGSKYIGHPFHIHINDYQSKNSDTELDGKRSLEDVTMLNSSGFRYFDTKSKEIVELAPFRGELHEIDEAQSSETSAQISTWGANDQTIRMLYQDYLGTYVFHCHILPHEDAGMMQVITIVENTDSSWLVPAESDNYINENGAIKLRQAQDFSTRQLTPLASNAKILRMQAGDLTHDFTQDIVLSRKGTNKTFGTLEIYDGTAALNNETELLSEITPYDSVHAPWAFIEDFTGDGKRDLVTAGFAEGADKTVDLSNLQIKAWSSMKDGRKWKNVFDFDPFDDISTHLHINDKKHMPVKNLKASQVSVAMADMNLDNFQDIAISYAIKKGGLRIVVLDGAAMSLNYQTGTMEGGYLPDDNVLADAIIQDKSLQGLSDVVLTSGFSSYAQSALEDLIITTETSSTNKKQVFTTQLQAGHFIATSEMSSSEDGGSHAGHGVMLTEDERISHIRNDSMPLSITETDHYNKKGKVASPVIAGVFGTTGLAVDNKLVIAQGISNDQYSYGNASSSSNLFNTSQQLVLNLDQIEKVNNVDLKGVLGSDLKTTFGGQKSQQRLNMANLTFIAYAGETMAPSDLAQAAGAVLGQGGTSEDFAQDLLSNPTSSAIIEANYGGSLNNLSVRDIVTGATTNLYGRDASNSEIKSWKSAVSDGLDQSLIPLALLQNTTGDDIYRTALMSAVAQWNQVQWSTNANQLGSFGQGLQSDETRFQAISSPLAQIGALSSWDEARSELASYTSTALETLIGTEISKSGFF